MIRDTQNEKLRDIISIFLDKLNNAFLFREARFLWLRDLNFSVVLIGFTKTWDIAVTQKRSNARPGLKSNKWLYLASRQKEFKIFLLISHY